MAPVKVNRPIGQLERRLGDKRDMVAAKHGTDNSHRPECG